MTLREICDKIGDGAKLEELALKLNDNKPVKAAAWLKEAIKPELLPEFDPYDVYEERYVLICVSGYDNNILFYRSYPSQQEAREEMVKQYEYGKADDCSAFEYDITETTAWLGGSANTIVEGSINWWILPADKIYNDIYDYEPIK